MKKLDESKRYKLSDASDEQIQQVLEYLKTTNTSWRTLTKKGELVCVFGTWGREESSFYDCCITTLFEEDVLKIGDTFEYNGFVCEVLHQIDEKKWFILKSPNNKDISYEKLDSEGLKDINHLYTKQEITNKEFIKQLEIHSK